MSGDEVINDPSALPQVIPAEYWYGGDCAYPVEPLTVEQFRLLFSPAFDDLTKYPDEKIALWISMAPVNPEVWCEQYMLGLALWVAHELKKVDMAAGPNGLGTGSSSGPASQKSVGPVSVSYDTGLTKVEGRGAGPYNYTIYGQQFYAMAQLLGVGSPIQVGAASPGPWGVRGRGWQGPIPYPIGSSGFSS